LRVGCELDQKEGWWVVFWSWGGGGHRVVPEYGLLEQRA
jgi:hypothetical protein